MRTIAAAAMAALLGALAPERANAGAYGFTTLDFPGAAETVARGINDAGTVVGNAGGPASETTGGFTYSGGAYAAVSVTPEPGGVAAPASANGINDAGAIVGSYAAPASGGPGSVGRTLGYLLTGGSLTSIERPPSQVIPYGVGAGGVVTGRVQGASPGSVGGFTYSDGVIRGIPQSLPSASLYPTFVSYGLNDAGHLVGKYFDAFGGVSGFFYDGAAETRVSVPGSRYTYAYGINNADYIVGYYGSGGDVQGFVDVGGVFSTLDVPGATATVIWDINNLGQVVGQFTDAFGTHGFLATPVSAVPEPAPALVLTAGLAGIAAAGRRRPSGPR